MTTVEERLKSVENRFRKGSKQYDAARYIIRQNRMITSEDRKAICQEIPIKYKTLTGLFSEMRKMGVYPPQETSDIPISSLAPEKPQEILPHTTEDPQPILQEYVMKEDFEVLRNSTNEKLETLKDSVNNLTSLLNEKHPSNLGDLPSDDPAARKDLETYPPQPYIPYTLETTGIGRRVLLTPKALMIFDIFRSCGFDGDLSDFIEDSIDYMYQTRKPADRRNYGVI